MPRGTGSRGNGVSRGRGSRGKGVSKGDSFYASNAALGKLVIIIGWK